MPDLTKKTTIRKGVMIPCFAFMAFIIVLGIFKNDWLKTICKSAFRFSLINFGWAYQLVAMASLVCVAVVTFSKIGNLRIGGPNARPKYSFKTWFAMALTGGISVGIVNWGVNEPMVYFGNVYGELEQLGIAPQSAEAYRFALGRCFYNWTFVPYAFYGITGLLMAYLFFNKKSKFSVAATLKPVLGKHADKTGVAAVADTLCSIGIVLGMACGLGTGLSFIISGLKVVYGLETGIPTWVILGLATTAIFTGAAYLGIDKGVKKLASFNSKIFYGLLILLIIIGPTIEISTLHLRFQSADDTQVVLLDLVHITRNRKRQCGQCLLLRQRTELFIDLISLQRDLFNVLRVLFEKIKLRFQVCCHNK